MSEIDEPVLGTSCGAPGRAAEAEPTLRDRIRTLVEQQPFAVLCTQGEGQPYGSMVAIAFAPDLTAAVFATPITTRKFRLLSECHQVALVLDNRAGAPADMMRIEAVTVTGRARQLAAGAEHDRWVSRLLARHGYLESFVRAPSCALFRIDVARYLHVVRFQEVREWIPPAAG